MLYINFNLKRILKFIKNCNVKVNVNLYDTKFVQLFVRKIFDCDTRIHETLAEMHEYYMEKSITDEVQLIISQIDFLSRIKLLNS